MLKHCTLCFIGGWRAKPVGNLEWRILPRWIGHPWGVTAPHTQRAISDREGGEGSAPDGVCPGGVYFIKKYWNSHLKWDVSGLLIGTSVCATNLERAFAECWNGSFWMSYPHALVKVWCCRNDHSILTEALPCILFFTVSLVSARCGWALYLLLFTEITNSRWIGAEPCCSELQGGGHSNPGSLNPLLSQQATLLMVLLLVADTTGQIPSSFSAPQEPLAQ